MVNKVTLIGRIGQDPDFRATPSGTNIARLSVATNRRWRGNDGQWQEETEWHRVVTFGKRAESVRNYMSKGRLVYVEGRIHYDSYTDKDGVKKYSTDIIADYIRLLDKSEGGGSQSASYSNQGPSYSNQNNESFVDDTEDDVPF